jgi:hypothetical protein
VQSWLAGGAGSSKLLSAFVAKGADKTLRFTNEVGAMVQQQDQMDSEMHLIRIDNEASAGAAELSGEEWGKRVLITNTVGDAVQGLYELIHSVFAPKLLGSVRCTAPPLPPRAHSAIAHSRFVCLWHFALALAPTQRL